MKKLSALLGCAFLSTLGIGSASAAPIAVKITGHVTGWTNSGFLNGIEMGQPVTAIYIYDTSLPDQDPAATAGRYQTSGLQASVRVSTGPWHFESQAMSTVIVFVQQTPSPWSNWLGMQILSSNGKPIGSESQGPLITFDIWNWSGYAPPSTALPTGAPDLSMYSNREINVSGMDENSNPYQVLASIDTAEVIGGVEVSPAAGSFLPQQHFDAALFLPPGSNVVSMSATAGGVALPLSYPGTCQLVSSPQSAILCPDAHTALAGAASNDIHWSVELADGTVITENVDWRLVQ